MLRHEGRSPDRSEEPWPEQSFDRRGDLCAARRASIILGRTLVATRTHDVKLFSKNFVRRFSTFLCAFLSTNVARPAGLHIWSARQGICQEINLCLWPSGEFRFVNRP